MGEKVYANSQAHSSFQVPLAQMTSQLLQCCSARIFQSCCELVWSCRDPLYVQRHSYGSCQIYSLSQLKAGLESWVGFSPHHTRTPWWVCLFSLLFLHSSDVKSQLFFPCSNSEGSASVELLGQAATNIYSTTHLEALMVPQPVLNHIHKETRSSICWFTVPQLEKWLNDLLQAALRMLLV